MSASHEDCRVVGLGLSYEVFELRMGRTREARGCVSWLTPNRRTAARGAVAPLQEEYLPKKGVRAERQQGDRAITRVVLPT